MKKLTTGNAREDLTLRIEGLPDHGQKLADRWSNGDLEGAARVLKYMRRTLADVEQAIKDDLFDNLK